MWWRGRVAPSLLPLREKVAPQATDEGFERNEGLDIEALALPPRLIIRLACLTAAQRPARRSSKKWRHLKRNVVVEFFNYIIQYLVSSHGAPPCHLVKLSHQKIKVSIRSIFIKIFVIESLHNLSFTIK